MMWRHSAQWPTRKSAFRPHSNLTFDMHIEECSGAFINGAPDARSSKPAEGPFSDGMRVSRLKRNPLSMAGGSANARCCRR